MNPQTLETQQPVQLYQQKGIHQTTSSFTPRRKRTRSRKHGDVVQNRHENEAFDHGSEAETEDSWTSGVHPVREDVIQNAPTSCGPREPTSPQMNGGAQREHGNTPVAEYEDVETMEGAAKFMYYKNIFTCSISFFFLFSSFVGLAIIQSSLNGEVGVAGLAVIFMVTIVACIVLMPVAVRLLGCKKTMLVSVLGFLAWELSSFYPHWALVIPTAILCGLANGIVWGAQATYFTQRSVDYAAVMQEREDLTIAKSFGVFFCFLLLGTSFGCLLTSLILSTNLNNDQVSGTKPPPGPQEHCGSAFCQHGGLTPEESAGGASAGQLPQILQSLLTPSDTGEAADLHQADTSSDTKADEYYLMVGVHCLITLLALILLAVFLDDLPKDKLHEEDSLKIQAKRSIMDTLRQLRRRRQLLLTPLNYYTGLCKSFMLADITEAYVGCALGIEMIGYTTATYGIVACLVSLACGYLIGKTGRIPIFTVGYMVSLFTCLLLLLWVPDSSQVGLFFIIPMLWAIPDGIFISQLNSLYGYMFNDNAQGAFATFRFWEGIGLVCGYLFSALLCVDIKLYIILAFGILGIVCYYCAECVQSRRDIRRPRAPSRVSGDVHFTPRDPVAIGDVSIVSLDQEPQLRRRPAVSNNAPVSSMFCVAVPDERRGSQSTVSQRSSNYSFVPSTIFETSI